MHGPDGAWGPRDYADPDGDVAEDASGETARAYRVFAVAGALDPLERDEQGMNASRAQGSLIANHHSISMGQVVAYRTRTCGPIITKENRVRQ